jgi:hypothetical protein
VRSELRDGHLRRPHPHPPGARAAARPPKSAIERPAGKPNSGCPPTRCSRPVSRAGATRRLRFPSLGQAWNPSAGAEPRKGPRQAVGQRLGEACDPRAARRRLVCSRNHRSAEPTGPMIPQDADRPAPSSRPAVAGMRWERSRVSTAERSEQPALPRRTPPATIRRRGPAGPTAAPRLAWGRRLARAPDWYFARAPRPRRKPAPAGGRKAGLRLPFASPALRLAP